ncbi:EmrB/QacA subfamily drug resistance transporter [Kribbella amoyensis]|uniref:EmrB/QacA subfamily drug resistance transporter n=1 Tax=Kribbella amoyensis TaxID=996641 RepID=A0A561BS62_9ACTN|nr:DHA2 family efflux MFS transporter permease subunit [Kribbella amoyensis]TWD81740.1 EmrB/QacA subfamily drug resistance transporter [Kribbella amoyensis]
MSELAAGSPARAEALVPLRSRAGAALIAATVLASGVAWYDAYVVNVAVPALGTHFGASVTAVQWTLTSYLLAVAALLLLAGALADRFGRRRILVIGLGVMLAGSVLCATAPSIEWLIGARAVQGVGAALVVPISLALLNGTLRVSDRARGIGIWAGLSTLMTTVGPYAGGWLIDHASWHWVFLVPIPLILVVFVVLRAVPDPSQASRSLSVDVVGAVLGALGLGGVVYALSEGAASGWSSPRVLVAGVVGVVSLVVLLPYERRQRAPMLKLSLFGSRQFDAINVVTVLLYGALAAAGYLFVVMCQLKLGYTAAQSGAALIPASVVFLILSPFSGSLVSRVGPRWLMVAGIVLIALAQVLLAQVEPGSGYLTAILPAALVQGAGLGLTVTPLTAAVLAAVSDADLGEASAVNDAAARVGAVAAIALVPVLLGVGAGSSLAESLTDGYRPAMIVLGAVCAGAAIVAGLFVSNERADAPRLAPPAPHHGCALPVTSSH